MSNITYIYVLKNPENNEIRYVGKTNNVEQRFKAHLNPARFRNTHKFNWIKKLRNKNLKPIIEIIEECDKSVWKEREKYWIKHYSELGCRLTNCTVGGDGLTYGNKTSFKKGDIPWNNGTANKSECCVCGKTFKIYKADLDRGRCCCSKKCGQKKRVENKLVKKTLFKKGQVSLNRKKVFQYTKNKKTFIKEFESVRNASTCLKINEVAIARCCRGLSKSSGGFYWSYTKLN